MIGDLASDQEKGLISRIGIQLFKEIQRKKESQQHQHSAFSIKVSYCEIYQERVRDLLLLDTTLSTEEELPVNLKVREHPITGPFVEGLGCHVVTSYNQLEELLNSGHQRRTVAMTSMNAQSSRSHAIFTLSFTQTTVDTLTLEVIDERTSKLSLIDLAGSERALASGAVGERLKEAAKINQSLSTLGRVISTLSERGSFNDPTQNPNPTKNKMSTRVPYRDSVLTWLLRESLGGNSKTTMLASISPSAAHVEETMSTLRYAESAKRVINRAQVNEDPHLKIIRQLREELDDVRRQLVFQTTNALVPVPSIPKVPEVSRTTRDIMIQVDLENLILPADPIIYHVDPQEALDLERPEIQTLVELEQKDKVDTTLISENSCPHDNQQEPEVFERPASVLLGSCQVFFNNKQAHAGFPSTLPIFNSSGLQLGFGIFRCAGPTLDRAQLELKEIELFPSPSLSVGGTIVATYYQLHQHDSAIAEEQNQVTTHKHLKPTRRRRKKKELYFTSATTADPDTRYLFRFQHILKTSSGSFEIQFWYSGLSHLKLRLSPALDQSSKDHNKWQLLEDLFSKNDDDHHHHANNIALTKQRQSVDCFVALDIQEESHTSKGKYAPVLLKSEADHVTFRCTEHRPRRLVVRITQADNQPFCLVGIANVQMKEEDVLQSTTSRTPYYSSWTKSFHHTFGSNAPPALMTTSKFQRPSFSKYCPLEIQDQILDVRTRTLTCVLSWNTRVLEHVSVEHHVFRIVLALETSLQTPWPFILSTPIQMKIKSLARSGALKTSQGFIPSWFYQSPRVSTIRSVTLGAWYRFEVDPHELALDPAPAPAPESQPSPESARDQIIPSLLRLHDERLACHKTLEILNVERQFFFQRRKLQHQREVTEHAKVHEPHHAQVKFVRQGREWFLCFQRSHEVLFQVWMHVWSGYVVSRGLENVSRSCQAHHTHVRCHALRPGILGFGDRGGYLMLRRTKTSTWQRKWCIIQRPFVSFYKTFDLKDPRHVMDLSTCEILNSELPFGFYLQSQETKWHIQASNDSEMRAWIVAMDHHHHHS